MKCQQWHKGSTNCEAKINKLKGGYSATANLIFQLWLKYIRGHMEDWNLMEREAIQLDKILTAENVHIEVEFYMGMVVEDQQTFEGLSNILRMLSSLGRPYVRLLVIFMVRPRRRMSLKMYLPMIFRF